MRVKVWSYLQHKTVTPPATSRAVKTKPPILSAS